MESKRLNELKEYGLDKFPEDELQLLVQIAAELCHAPYAFISIVDEKTVWTKVEWNHPKVVSKREEDICHYTIMQDKPLMISNLNKDEITKALPIGSDNSPFKAYVGANLVTPNGFKIGTLCVLTDTVREFSNHQVKLLSGLAQQVVNNFELNKKNKQLEESNQILEKIANEDFLTGLPNRRSFFQTLENSRASLNQNELLILFFVDIDDFKSVNDNLGHDVGDLVLEGIGKLLSRYASSSVFLGRFGGEEFCIHIVSKIDFNYLEFAETIRKEISGLTFSYPHEDIKITISIGISKMNYKEEIKISELIKQSDISLYRAKTSGKNRVIEFS